MESQESDVLGINHSTVWLTAQQMIRNLKLWGQSIGLQVKWMQNEILQGAQEINNNNKK